MTIMNTAISGLIAAQRALTTTSHNIANINTPGYSRQVTVLESLSPQFSGSGFIGKGVEVSTIKRLHDEFLTVQLRSSTSSNAENEIFFELASRVDNLVADEQTGLSPALLNFFNTVQDVADIPSSITARQTMISEASSLAARFQFIDGQLSVLTDDIRTGLKQDITSINSLATAIADINERIVNGINRNVSVQPNDLLDQRDELVRKLSELVSVSTTLQGDGALNVFTGNGHPIVLGQVTSNFNISETFPGNFDIVLSSPFSTLNITDDLRGGNIGGLLRFQQEMLDPTLNSLGRLATGLAETFNDQHRLGMNLDGDIDVPFFSPGAAQVLPLAGAVNNIAASIVDSTALTVSDYNLTFNGGTSYTLTRLSDGQTTAIDTLGASPFTTATIDGFTLTITAGASAGDEYIVRPVINGARDLGVAITDPRKIAAADPLRSGEAVNVNGLPTNTGSAIISQADTSTLVGLPLLSSITLTFDATLNQFNISAPPGGTLAYNPVTEGSGKQFSIAAAGNATFTISGTPANGDRFVIENNTNADGDNRNALLLAGLQSQPVLLGGTASYQDTYGQLVAEAGTQTRQVEISSLAIGSLLDQAIEARESFSGVNLDEEAANMLRFQQAYQAAAQLISTADRLFQDLINAFR